MSKQDFMRRAIDLALERMRANKGGPFGAVIVRDGVIVAEGWNEVTSTCDPTAHAEIVAIRRACTKLGTFHLPDCEIYASCEPCPMCLGAIYWARFRAFYYANTRQEAPQPASTMNSSIARYRWRLPHARFQVCIYARRNPGSRLPNGQLNSIKSDIE